MTTISDEGLPIRFQRVPSRKSIAASDDFSVLGVFKDGYQPHQYEDWLLNNVAKSARDPSNDVVASGFGRKTTPSGVVMLSGTDTSTHATRLRRRPADEIDRLSSSAKRTITKTVCDNNGHCAGRTWRAAEVPTLTYSGSCDVVVGA